VRLLQQQPNRGRQSHGTWAARPSNPSKGCEEAGPFPGRSDSTCAQGRAAPATSSSTGRPATHHSRPKQNHPRIHSDLAVRPMAYNRGRQGRAWWKLTKQIRAEVEMYGLPCHLCGKPIDLTLHHLHPRSFTVDHIIPLADGGPEVDRDNCAPACRGCNSAKANRARARKRQRTQHLMQTNKEQNTQRTSREW
jgi:5-methylcytosine-specific restriction endonuclease McrA